MKEENKNGQLPEKEQLLSSLRNAEEMYVFMSLCTKMPYVLCDEETFDDEVLLYYTEEDAQREGKKLIEQRIPIQIAKIEKKQLLGFFSSLYPMGVNGLLINKNMESEARLQLGELVIRPNTEDLPDGKVWVENPQLHLTALYFMQEMRRQEKPELTEELKGLQEEILVNYGRGRFIVAVHKENGMPMRVRMEVSCSKGTYFIFCRECRCSNRRTEMHISRFSQISWSFENSIKRISLRQWLLKQKMFRRCW